MPYDLAWIAGIGDGSDAIDRGFQLPGDLHFDAAGTIDRDTGIVGAQSGQLHFSGPTRRTSIAPTWPLACKVPAPLRASASLGPVMPSIDTIRAPLEAMESIAGTSICTFSAGRWYHVPFMCSTIRMPLSTLVMMSGNA